MITVNFVPDPQRPTDPAKLIGQYHSEREARVAARQALGVARLVGAWSWPTEAGVAYAAGPGEEAAYVEIVYGKGGRG